MTETVLQEAERLINGDRAKDYGDVTVNFKRIAGMWGAYKGTEFTPHDVAMMMVLVKVARQATGFHRDSNVDIGGYAGLDEQVYNADPITPYVEAFKLAVEQLDESNINEAVSAYENVDPNTLADWERELLGFEDRGPRVWLSLTEVPKGQEVWGMDGVGDGWFGEGPDGDGYEEFGPFTEILEGTE